MPKTKRRRGLRMWGLFLLLLVVAGIIGRLLLPGVVTDYVNRTLDRNPLYAGRIGSVEMNLWRGAYSIHDVRLSKVTGNVPEPLLKAKRVEFAVQWDALLHRKLVASVLLVEPEVNFVDGAGEGEDQTGAGGPWLGMIGNLFPFSINRAIVQNGSVFFRSYKTGQPVEVHISKIEATVDNLTNIRDETRLLVSTIHATGQVMDQAKLEFRMVLDPFSYRPTFHMTTRLLGLDVTTLNDLARTYGSLDFERGWFDLVVEADAQEGRLTGYAKPLFRELKVFSVSGDVGNENPLRTFWEALVGAVTTVFENQPRQQFGTLIPFHGDLSGATTADILATLGNVLRNAFVRAYLPSLANGSNADALLQFDPPEFTEQLATGT